MLSVTVGSVGSVCGSDGSGCEGLTGVPVVARVGVGVVVGFRVVPVATVVRVCRSQCVVL